MTQPDPTSARVLLARELRDLREAAGLDGPTVAERTGWSLQKVYRSEDGTRTQKADEVDQLLDLYGASHEVAERIRATAALARRRSSYGKVADWARQYVGLEREATSLAFHQEVLVPGLFQTEAYARAVVSTSQVIAPADVPEVVAARMRRSDLLHRTNAPRVHLVLGEAATRRKVGGAAVLDEQLAHLEEVAALPHVTVQILPDDVGAHAALGTGFVLLTLKIGGQKSKWAYLEDLMRGECRPDQSQVNVYQLTFDSLAVNALGESGTLQLLAEARAKLR